MTRINVVRPGDLADQHLIAEYRELPRVFALAEAALLKRGAARVRASSPPAYTLGEGHVCFFYPRTGYLARRQAEIIAECVRRGFAPKHRTPPTPVPGLDDDWTPTAEALAMNRARIAERIAARPDFYRFTGVPPC